MIYADNAATTKMCPAAIEAMTKCMAENYGNPSSLYSFGQQAKEALEDARERIANCLGCTPREITFTSGGSEADNQAIFSAAKLGAKKGKKHIISTTFEHHAVLHTLDKLKQQGFEITLLDVHSNGIVTPEQVRDAIREDTCLVTVMFANNEIGTIQPIAEIGKIAHEHGIVFHTDAVQAIGAIPINVDAMNIDMLSMSGHKFHGPKGIGVLYIRTGVRIDTFMHGGAQERGQRAGTENLPGIVGIGKAIEMATQNLESNAARMSRLRDRLIDGILAEIPDVRLNGHRTERLPNNVNVSIRYVEGEALLLRLDLAGIAGSSGSACTSGSLDPSHVLLAIGLPHEIAHGSLRLSLGTDTTDADVDEVLRVLPGIVKTLREMSALNPNTSPLGGSCPFMCTKCDPKKD